MFGRITKPEVADVHMPATAADLPRPPNKRWPHYLAEAAVVIVAGIVLFWLTR
ncbi:hypothetical protein [Dyella sp. ASV21]|uniref:hypothetical protein n=1 Tax=Dyella sp. ASV21 TaxID=2795114 RepID=UPI0018EA9998|nr:hypothetical protein [Dyella sp. ASV21]